MNDIVIPYKQSFSNEIVYCLRSLKNIEHGQVYVIGDRPRLKVNWINYTQTLDISKNTLDILNIAVDSDEISDNFIWMADDMYIVNKVDSVPVLHRGRYIDIINGYKRLRKYNYYTQRMQRTYNKLIKLGIQNPLCYELHVPFMIDKSKWNDVSIHITPDVNKLSMYANLIGLEGKKVPDVKVRSRDWIPPGDFISTHDSTFGVNKVGHMIRTKFNEKGEYDFKG